MQFEQPTSFTFLKYAFVYLSNFYGVSRVGRTENAHVMLGVALPQAPIASREGKQELSSGQLLV